MLSTAVNMLYLMGVYLNAFHVFFFICFVLKEIKNNVLKNLKNNASF